MKYSTTCKLGLAAVALLASAAVSACQGPCGVYRTYYLDNACRVVYFDAMGHRVVENRYSTDALVGLPLKQDCSGRWYYKDSFGNIIYKVNRCG